MLLHNSRPIHEQAAEHLRVSPRSTRTKLWRINLRHDRVTKRLRAEQECGEHLMRSNAIFEISLLSNTSVVEQVIIVL